MRIGIGADAAQREAGKPVIGQAQRRSQRALCVLTGPVGLGDARVVVGPGVIAVVDIGKQQRDIGTQIVRQLPAQFAAQQVLVKAIGIVATQVGIATVTIAAIGMRNQTIGAIAIGQRVVKHQATGTQPIVAQFGIRAQQGPVLRRLRGQAYESGQGIGTGCRALRSAQHFDARRVIERGRHSDSREVDVIDEKTHR